MSATIVIVATGSDETLGPTLASVVREARAETPPHAVLVVEASGAESVAALVRGDSMVRLIARAGREGASAASNAGAASAATEHVVMIDEAGAPDEEGYLGRLLAPFERPASRLFAAAWSEGGDPVAAWSVSFHRGRVTLANDPWTRGLDAAAYDRALWAALGGLDRRYETRVWAEADLAWRAQRRGWRLETVGARAASDLSERRVGGREMRRSGEEAAAFERDRLVFTWKNLGGALMARHLAWLPWHLACAGAERRALLSGFASAAAGLGGLRRARRFERTMARLTDKAILSNFGA